MGMIVGVTTKCKTFRIEHDDLINKWINQEMLNGYSFVQGVASNGWITIFLNKRAFRRSEKRKF